MDAIDDFKIKKSRGEYVLYNHKSVNGGHSHIGTKGTCHKLVRWICDKVVPRSDYLKISAIRLSRDEKYIKKVKKHLN